ncbi:dCTP deaminase [Candidatus Bipolaricaulota bacterium]|nr:dCTP deaminase [Candidatus Bipolaricaulota bacterium]
MFLFGKELEGYVDGIIHEETQLANIGIDLTVDGVKKPSSPTDLDFGGSEEKSGDLEVVEPEKRSPGDDYGWWNLEGGIYIIDFNEEVSVSKGLGIVVPLDRMTSGGSYHHPIVFQGDLDKKPVLHVNSSGLNLKENARLSRLVVWT